MAMDFSDVIYEKRAGIARVTMNRPRVYNAWTDNTMAEIARAIQDAGEDRSVGVVVLTGAGDKAFSSGGDVKWERAGGERSMYDNYWDIHNAMRLCLKPIIARINGFCIGGAHHVAYFADLSIAAEHAVFGQVGPKVGSPAGDHLVSYLVRVVGAKKAREIWYLCRQYSAREALAMGLVNAVVPYEQLDAEVDKWCQEILDKSPTCLAVLKASFEREFDYLRDSMFTVQRLIAPHFMNSPEQLEGQNAFLEKRPPNFRQFRQ